jgi:hypothetical protein
MGACTCILYAAVDPSISVSTPSTPDYPDYPEYAAVDPSIGMAEHRALRMCIVPIGAYPSPAQHTVLSLMQRAPHVTAGCASPSGPHRTRGSPSTHTRTAGTHTGLTFAPDALGSCGRAITFAACRAHVVVLCECVCVCLCLCVFACLLCSGNGARLALQLAHKADGRARAGLPFTACWRIDRPLLPESCDAPPRTPRRPVARAARCGSLTGTPRWAAPSSCRCRAVVWRSKCRHSSCRR